MDDVAFRMQAFGLWLEQSIANAVHPLVLSNVGAAD
ncbi:hypothetical protein ACVIHH_004649 [Bradyrhizobium sp. USDA 4518]|nr:hypothetical protein [Bradyrhizobium sp. USDA 4545]MCP1854201.1 hypothetical protein [Bradyrhizobium sp. USDA 4541]MCP1909117.1 hypothetical protein [Bradyrhizobium elkanii]MCP1919837.1 hypothetical protein [Bradyrhizobium sp. USDA 4532]